MKITFRAFDEHAGKNDITPVPAVRTIPKWFTAIPKFVNKDTKFKFFSNGNKNVTVKWCSPFLDSFSTGYVVLLENDVQIYKDENGDRKIAWGRGGDELISQHGIDQISMGQVPEGFSPQPLKFANPWSIQTPKGYSVLFVHPLNRDELPFHTLSGVVDTDEYYMPVNFPFLLREDFEGIIEAGTPIAQLIPIKRESWTHEIKEHDPEFVERNSAKFKSKIYRAYKSLYWKRKDYK